MSRRPARCTEADIRRAAKVAKEMGMAVDILPDGTIRIGERPPDSDAPAPHAKWTTRSVA